MQENWLSADVVIFLDFNSTIRLLTANFLPRSVDNYKSVNETGYGRSWDWKQGWVVIWLWVIFSELGHGRSGDRKRGGHQAGTKIFITSLFWTYCVPDLCELPSLRKKMHHNAYTSFPSSTHLPTPQKNTHCKPFSVLKRTQKQPLFLQSTPFPSLNCHHFCTIWPVMTYLIKNGQ